MAIRTVEFTTGLPVKINSDLLQKETTALYPDITVYYFPEEWVTSGVGGSEAYNLVGERIVFTDVDDLIVDQDLQDILDGHSPAEDDEEEKETTAVAVFDEILPSTSSVTTIEGNVSSNASDISTHMADSGNPHSISAVDVGLDNVTNDAALKREAGDFDSFTLKAVPTISDIVLIEDAADSFNKKEVSIGNLSSQPLWNASSIQSEVVSTDTPNASDVLTYSGGQWTPLPVGAADIPWELGYAFNTDNNKTVYTASPTWEVVSKILYPGSSVYGDPSAILAILSSNGITKTAHVRLYDYTNALEIASISTNSVAPVTLQLAPISNIPTGEAQLEIQMRVDGGGGKGYLYAFSIRMV